MQRKCSPSVGNGRDRHTTDLGHNQILERVNVLRLAYTLHEFWRVAIALAQKPCLLDACVFWHPTMPSASRRAGRRHREFVETCGCLVCGGGNAGLAEIGVGFLELGDCIGDPQKTYGEILHLRVRLHLCEQQIEFLKRHSHEGLETPGFGAPLVLKLLDQGAVFNETPARLAVVNLPAAVSARLSHGTVSPLGIKGPLWLQTFWAGRRLPFGNFLEGGMALVHPLEYPVVSGHRAPECLDLQKSQALRSSWQILCSSWQILCSSWQILRSCRQNTVIWNRYCDLAGRIL